MTAAQFHASLAHAEPPALEPLLAALWWDAKGDWNRAHAIAQEEEGAAAAWVHAYLHRREGDNANAAYWYGQAEQAPCVLPLDKEWDQIVTGLLSGG